jgi:hypothetical protein
MNRVTAVAWWIWPSWWRRTCEAKIVRARDNIHVLPALYAWPAAYKLTSHTCEESLVCGVWCLRRLRRLHRLLLRRRRRICRGS